MTLTRNENRVARIRGASASSSLLVRRSFFSSYHAPRVHFNSVDGEDGKGWEELAISPAERRSFLERLNLLSPRDAIISILYGPLLDRISKAKRENPRCSKPKAKSRAASPFLLGRVRLFSPDGLIFDTAQSNDTPWLSPFF